MKPKPNYRAKRAKTEQSTPNLNKCEGSLFSSIIMAYNEFLSEGRTVHKEYYLEIMRRLREVIRRKRPDLWKNNSPLLHHDNAPTRTSLSVRDDLAKNNTVIMSQPSYSPNSPSHYFFLFPKLTHARTEVCHD